MTDFERDVTGIAALADPARRELYDYVCSQADPVGRDAAAEALGIPHHRAKFHLDRLEAEGLLEVDYARLTGRSGPGAGRPAKLYRRADRDIAVSLPAREYELAGQIMADAIAESMQTGTSVAQALTSAATSRGRSLGAMAPATHVSGLPNGPGVAEDADALSVAMRVLAANGYEPRRETAAGVAGDDGGRPERGQAEGRPAAEDGRVVMANCPFHALARTHTQLVCEMNHALITGLTNTIAPGRLCATLEPGEDRCCVVLTTR